MSKVVGMVVARVVVRMDVGDIFVSVRMAMD